MNTCMPYIHSQGDRSPWAPYLGLLPTPTDMRAYHPLFFGDATIAAFEGSDVQAPLRRRRDSEVSRFALVFGTAPPADEGCSAGGGPAAEGSFGAGRELEVKNNLILLLLFVFVCHPKKLQIPSKIRMYVVCMYYVFTCVTCMHPHAGSTHSLVYTYIYIHNYDLTYKIDK